MDKAVKTKLLRVIDANFNRAKEGLRVCEDICRFVYDHRSLTSGFKDLRHELTEAFESLTVLEVIRARAVHTDVGRETTLPELSRKTVRDVFYANAQRVKESIRVLEEVVKLFDRKTVDRIKSLRYRVYTLEKKFSVMKCHK